MATYGCRHIKWTKEKEEELIDLISQGKKCIQITTIMKISHMSIYNKLKTMGFDNFSDARKVLTS